MDGGTPLHRPASLLDWRQEPGTERYVGGAYEIVLVEPRKWDVRHRGEHVGYDESREASFQMAERHHRDALRRRDLLTWGTVAMAAFLGVSAVYAGVERGSLLWVLVLAALFYACIAGIIRFVAALSRNPANPYRRRDPWERRRRRRR